MDTRESIRKYALQNALRYEGKANPGNIIGKVIGENPEIKSMGKELMNQIQEIVKEVNSMNIEEQRKELEKKAPEMLEKKTVEKEPLKPLKGAEEGKVVMRVAPSPSGPLHIGHAYIIGLNDAYCRKYRGKLIIRIEDTNSDNIYPSAYEMIPENADWLTDSNVAGVVIQSDRMDIYYRYAEELIKKSHAYVCTCTAEQFRETKIKGIPCSCRNISSEENLERWKKMFSDFKEGEAAVRIKTDINHKNPAMRDWPAFRINDSEHPRHGKKYRVWPLMNFAVAVDDHELGITHTLRGKDHMDNEKRQKFLYDYMSWKMPEAVYVGRINFEGIEVSCSKTKEAIERGEFEGWDDIRVPFIPALRRRGYQHEAFIRYALDVGVTQNDKTVSKEDFFKSINHFNTEIIEPKAKRFFFVKDPVRITVDGAPEKDTELDLHPEFMKGGRNLKSCSEFWIERQDLNQIREGDLVRLMGCLNFRKNGDKFVFESTELEQYRKEGAMIIHWLPAGCDPVHVSVRMDDNSLLKGIGEPGMKQLNVGDIIQMERFAFARLDSKEDSRMEFWFTHN